MNREPKCTLAEGFSVWEKVWAQLSFTVMGVLGTVGIVLTQQFPVSLLCDGIGRKQEKVFALT